MKQKMKNRFVFLSLITLIVSMSCSTSVRNAAQDVLQFQSIVDSQIDENIPGILVTIISKEKNIDWSGASGYSDKLNETKLLQDQTFRIASVTKTFVAATILRLWEDGKLELEDPIAKYVSEEHIAILTNGGYNPQEITIYHLLTHSGGLSEHTQTEKYTIAYMKTNHIWTRTEQLNDLVTFTSPVGKPGEKFSYSDTGYILLGEIIESITRQPLGEALVEQLKLRKFGLNDIYMENVKGDFSSNRIHQYLENEDTYYINPSLDYYGGGGLLSTTRDLSLFYLYLFDNKIFNYKATLDKMLSSVNYSGEQALDYRMGIWKAEAGGMPVYTHTGFWGTQVVYIPDIKASIAVNYSQRWNNKGFAPIIPLIVEQLLKE